MQETWVGSMAWEYPKWAAVYGVTQSRTRLKQLSSSSTLYIRSLALIHFTAVNVYPLISISPFPSLPSSWRSSSTLYFYKFSLSISKNKWENIVCFSDISLSIVPQKLSMLLQKTEFPSVWLNNIPSHTHTHLTCTNTHTSHFLYPINHQWMLGFFQCLGYWESCCNEHGGSDWSLL